MGKRPGLGGLVLKEVEGITTSLCKDNNYLPRGDGLSTSWSEFRDLIKIMRGQRRVNCWIMCKSLDVSLPTSIRSFGNPTTLHFIQKPIPASSPLYKEEALLRLPWQPQGRSRDRKGEQNNVEPQ